MSTPQKTLDDFKRFVRHSAESEGGLAKHVAEVIIEWQDTMLEGEAPKAVLDFMATDLDNLEEAIRFWRRQLEAKR